VLYAHPVETSFVSGLHRCLVDTLRAKGHAVDDCDLYAENFDPVLTRVERIGYHDVPTNRAPVEAHVRRLENTDALILVFPVWNYGFPAILKGYLDRVFLPGVSFDLHGGGFFAKLLHVRRLAAVCTYGGARWRAVLAGDPPRRCVRRMLRLLIDPAGRCEYHAHYDMNRTTPERRAAFLREVERAFATW
jgi:putative NADPH-quinone reductase